VCASVVRADAPPDRIALRVAAPSQGPGRRGPWPRSRARRRPRRPQRSSRCPAPRRRCCSRGGPPPRGAPGCGRGGRPRRPGRAGSSPPPPAPSSAASPDGRLRPRRRSPRSRYGWIYARRSELVIGLVTLVVTRDVCV
jgi:hypothetical protein